MIGNTTSNTTTCQSECGYYIEPIATKDFTAPGEYSKWVIMESGTPYQVNGTFRYENNNSGIETKHFNFTSLGSQIQ